MDTETLSADDLLFSITLNFAAPVREILHAVADDRVSRIVLAPSDVSKPMLTGAVDSECSYRAWASDEHQRAN